MLLIKALEVPASAVDSEEDSSYEIVTASSACTKDTDSGRVNSDLPLEPETEIIFSLILISTPEGIDTGFLATLDIIKKPHK
jgi:hypothetical protein